MNNKTHNFNEKETEYYAPLQKEIPVWQSPKYTVAKAKAIEMIDSGKALKKLEELIQATNA